MFRNTILILTSNLGSELLLNDASTDGQISDKTKEQVLKIAQAHFKPEFLNRIDDIIMFTPLDLLAVTEIVTKFIERLTKRLADQEIKLVLSDELKAWIAKNGYDPAYGARPLQRFITEKIETPLAKALIAGQIMPHSEVLLKLAGDQVAFETKDLIQK